MDPDDVTTMYADVSSRWVARSAPRSPNFCSLPSLLLGWVLAARSWGTLSPPPLPVGCVCVQVVVIQLCHFATGSQIQPEAVYQ